MRAARMRGDRAGRDRRRGMVGGGITCVTASPGWTRRFAEHHAAGGIGVLSVLARSMRPSAIREILKVTERPEIISFAGGLPDPDLFPVQPIADALAGALAEEPARALQYGVTEGHGPLRAWVAERLGCRGVGPDQVSIVAGSQQGLDLLGRILLDPGDAVLVERPTYLGAAQAFAWQRPRFVGVPCDEEGPLPDAVAAAVASCRPKLLYLMPNFQNPSGRTIGLRRRCALIDVAARTGLPLVEDDPYGELRYSGTAQPSLLRLAADAEAPVIHLGTFSKTLSPGLRLGYVATSLPILRALTVAKQAACLHVSTLVQCAVARLLTRGEFDLQAHLDGLRATYRARRDALDGALREAFADGLSWRSPEGGMFLWASVRDRDVRAWFRASVAADVAFVPGDDFFPDGAPEPAVRLNFSHTAPGRIAEGVRRLRAAWEVAV